MMIVTRHGTRMYAVSCSGPLTWEAAPAETEEMAHRINSFIAWRALTVGGFVSCMLALAVLWLSVGTTLPASEAHRPFVSEANQ